MIQKVIRQSLVSLLVFVAVLFAFSRVDWMELFGLHRSIIEENWAMSIGNFSPSPKPLSTMRLSPRRSIRCFPPSAVPMAWSATKCRFIWWSATR